jgi:tetratricopeptide (TPR) repeat protein
MKTMSKIAVVALGLVLTGSSVFAQSLADAKKAIDGEQFQKAKSILKNLIVTQADKDENYFYLGWVYINQDYPDSAKTLFTKGLAINPKSALNIVGLGIVAHLEHDNTTATTNFNQAALLAGKNSKPYLYAGLSYLIPHGGRSGGPKGPKISSFDADAAIAILTKGKAVNPKDAEISLALGDAYRSQLNSNEAFSSYQNALALDPKLTAVYVATGVLWKFADNFTDSEGQFKAALAIDPNYGPAYREWAETDIRWAYSDPAQHDAKIKDAVENYKKYISLTDYSVESQMRYADFLVSAKDYATLQKVATELTASAKTNLRVYRYLGIAALENKDYPAGITAMNKWLSDANPSRIIPRDYLTLGHLQIGSKQDSLGILSLKKALDLDTSQVDIIGEIANSFYALKKYQEAGDAYHTYGQKSKQAKLSDHFKEGFSYYQAFKGQLIKAQTNPTIKADTSFLIRADSAFTYVESKAKTPQATIIYFHANVKNFEDGDRDNIKGLAKPLYEQYIQLILAKGGTLDDDTKGKMAEAYAYLGSIAQYKEKDDAKTLDMYTKAKDMDPTNPQAVYYFATKGKAKTK